MKNQRLSTHQVKTRVQPVHNKIVTPHTHKKKLSFKNEATTKKNNNLNLACCFRCDLAMSWFEFSLLLLVFGLRSYLNIYFDIQIALHFRSIRKLFVFSIICLWFVVQFSEIRQFSIGIDSLTIKSLDMNVANGQINQTIGSFVWFGLSGLNHVIFIEFHAICSFFCLFSVGLWCFLLE